MRKRKESFGPIVIYKDDGCFRASCDWCVFRIHTRCTHVSPSRTIPDIEHTPEWCEMREGMLRDAEKMERRNKQNRS